MAYVKDSYFNAYKKKLAYFQCYLFILNADLKSKDVLICSSRVMISDIPVECL